MDVRSAPWLHVVTESAIEHSCVAPRINVPLYLCKCVFVLDCDSVRAETIYHFQLNANAWFCVGLAVPLIAPKLY